MKFTTSTIIVSILAASTQAWELTVWMTDGRHVTSHGTKNSGCVTYDFAMTRAVNKAEFKDSLLADTFELYTQEKCGGKVSYRSGEGSHAVTPARTIKSYKVY
ncbi:hypothetical protein CC86DRAFT_469851 [Ophiobolus disseminans]|uniref:Uncharacterized protein n=1 Tax=Ophiobolus disseminans TaxID=1469910 RepID=A0A6A6ZN40_9PLEO|nr:hypothetical protein CC86DRAFT_469851 [Ophiobolus disseminans]